MLLLLLKYSFKFQQRLFACGETFNEKKKIIIKTLISSRES